MNTKNNMVWEVEMKKGVIFSIVLAFGFLMCGVAMAQTIESEITPPTTLIPGMIESTGTHFEINNSDYFNVVLDSSESITLRLESIPEMVTMHVEPASEAASTQITVSGFQPSTTYYKYEDNYHNLNEFTTDGNGSYSWTQDLSQSHFVFIQPRKSTKFIADNATGGDCYLIGTWDSATKTCTLTTDVYETIQIDSNYITLDGNGHAVIGTGTGNGVYLYGRTGVTIKNLNTKNFFTGIFLYSSNNNTLRGNTISNNWVGIYLWLYSNNTTLSDNMVLNNVATGIGLFISNNNIITYNTAVNNSYGIFLYSSSNNLLTDNTASNNRSDGIWLSFSDDNILTNNITLDNIFGIRVGGSYLVYSNNNTLTSNNTTGNGWGITLSFTSNNILSGNTSSKNWAMGINIEYSKNTMITYNTIEDNLFYGLFLLYSNSRDNQIYNNNFINNVTQAYVLGDANIFNLEKPTGGNYWSNFDTPTEGCYDANHDGFCDASYRFYGGVDYLPWAKQSGWEVPADTIPPTTTVTLSGTSGSNAWYVSDVQITLTAVDNANGSGIKEIHYSIDGGTVAVVAGSSASIMITTDRIHSFTYYSVDNAGNTEQAKTIAIKIDKTPPVITITGVSDGATYALGLVPNASYTVADSLSGVASSSANFTGGTGLGLGTFTYSVTATDNAGNSATASAVYTVIATADGLIALIQQMFASGQIDNAGIANSLISKVESAMNAQNDNASDNIMQAFINQVSAQAGQHISQDAAAILINAATYIINN